MAINDFPARKSPGLRLNFRHHFSAPNLWCDRIYQIAGGFGDVYERQLEGLLMPARHEVLSDLMNVRNDIAHGKYHAGRKLAPRRYFRLCREVYDSYLNEFLEQIIVTARPLNNS